MSVLETDARPVGLRPMEFSYKAPREGFEPPTGRLTAACSTPELSGNSVLLTSYISINPHLPFVKWGLNIHFLMNSYSRTRRFCQGNVEIFELLMRLYFVIKILVVPDLS